MNSLQLRARPAMPWWRGRTAVVTGASSGIGIELARALAVDVGVLVLVARRIERLEQLRQSLRAAHPDLQVHVHGCDLADPAARDRLATEVEGVAGPVDVLVNNAGLGDAARFDAADWTKVTRMVEVNVLATLRLTHDLVPGMVARAYGGVLNIGSGAGQVAMKSSAVYSGTKHFIDGFTESLRLDLAGTGVHVTQVCPGPVPTGFNEVAGTGEGLTGGPPKAMTISAEQCAAEALHGFAAGAALVYPGGTYRTMMRVLPLIPRSLLRRAVP